MTTWGKVRATEYVDGIHLFLCKDKKYMHACMHACMYACMNVFMYVCNYACKSAFSLKYPYLAMYVVNIDSDSITSCQEELMSGEEE